MCNNTKQKIAAALRQLMNEKPFEKITVQNLMDTTNMKRQSFYYHFQDTRDVLIWICRQELLDPLEESSLPFVDWVMLAMTMLDRERTFYRRVLTAVHEEFFREFDSRVLRPRMLELLYPGKSPQELDDNQRFTVEFAAQSAAARMMQFVHTRKALDTPLLRARVVYLIGTLKPGSR